MRDNIKPIEAGFFKYCMRNLSHDINCVKYWPFREKLPICTIIDTYCKKYNVSKKIIHGIVNKWINKRIARRNHYYLIGFSFCFDLLPLEYIMLIPRRVMRKVPVFGMLMSTDKAEDYALVFVFKTKANGLEDIDSINQTSRLLGWRV